jgi:hypothetical protein
MHVGRYVCTFMHMHILFQKTIWLSIAQTIFRGFDFVSVREREKMTVCTIHLSCAVCDPGESCRMDQIFEGNIFPFYC